MPPIKRAELDGAVFDYFARVGLDIDATRALLAEALAGKLSEVRALLADAERAGHEAAARLARVKRAFQDGKIDADDWAEQRAELSDEQTAADANVEHLRARERDVDAGAMFRDAETETLEALAGIRAAIAAQVTGAATDGVEGVRSALLRLFDHFTLYRRTDGDRHALPAGERIEAEHIAAALAEAAPEVAELAGGRFVVYGEVRPEATADFGESFRPISRKEPLYIAENNERRTFVT